jgi:hypothetical protein
MSFSKPLHVQRQGLFTLSIAFLNVSVWLCHCLTTHIDRVLAPAYILSPSSSGSTAAWEFRLPNPMPSTLPSRPTGKMPRSEMARTNLRRSGRQRQSPKTRGNRFCLHLLPHSTANYGVVLIGAEHLFYTEGKQNPNFEHYALVLYLISLIRLSIYKSLVHFQLRARH